MIHKKSSLIISVYLVILFMYKKYPTDIKLSTCFRVDRARSGAAMGL